MLTTWKCDGLSCGYTIITLSWLFRLLLDCLCYFAGKPLGEQQNISMKDIIGKIKEKTGVGMGMIGWFDIQQVRLQAVSDKLEALNELILSHVKLMQQSCNNIAMQQEYSFKVLIEHAG